MKKVYRALPAIVFGAFIAVMLVLFLVLPKEKISASEKRPLQEMPALTAESFFEGDFRENFELFLSDHFPWRNFWFGSNAYTHLALGQRSTGHDTPSDPDAGGIYYGADGYLINDPQNMSELMTNIGYIEECASHLSVPTAVLIAPSTGYVCEDKLPSPHYTYHDDEYFEQMASAFRSATFVDVREALRDAHSAGRQVFYKTDHHWTTYGAYTAYRALSDALGYEPNDIGAYEVTSYDGFYGTTYSGSGFWLNEPDRIEVWKNPANDGNIHVVIDDGGDTSGENASGGITEQDDMFFYEHLDEDDKYPIFLNGNHPIVTITNRNASSDETLLVVKDSFAHSLVPFLADHYAKIVMVDMRHQHNIIPPMIEEYGVDRVLFLYSIDNLAVDSDIKWIE